MEKGCKSRRWGKEMKISKGQKRVIEEGKIRKEAVTSLGFVLQWSYTIQQWVQIHSLSLQFELSRSRTWFVFTYPWSCFLQVFLGMKKQKNEEKKNPQPPKRCACSFANKPSLPQRPCWVWAMLPAALFRKVPFASPSARPLTAFSQKCRASFCLPEIAGQQNKSTFNEKIDTWIDKRGENQREFCWGKKIQPQRNKAKSWEAGCLTQCSLQLLARVSLAPSKTDYTVTTNSM